MFRGEKSNPPIRCRQYLLRSPITIACDCDPEGDKAARLTDDFYDVIVKPRVRKAFEALNQKLIPSNTKAKKVLILSVWYEQYDLVVSVSVIGEDFDKIIAQLDQVGVMQRNVLAQVAAAGVLAPVHHYTIEDGKVNTDPELLERVDELLLRRA